MADLLVAEDVWGAPFDELAKDFSLVRRPDAWRDRDALLAALSGVRGLVVRNRTQVDGDLLAHAPALEVVARAGVGLDNIDVDACDADEVAVVAPLGANAVSVAEHTFALALALARDLVGHDRSVREGRWERDPGRELAGGVWGLLGAGATARAVATRAAAFGMSVVGFDPYADPDAARAAGIELRGLEETVAAADVLSIHVPATAATRGMVDAELLARAQPGLLLLSVGRGEVVDEAALAAALHAGTVGGAGLDVRAEEPPLPGPLDGAPRVLFSPHVAGITGASQRRIVETLASGVRSVLHGEATPHAVGRVGRAVAVAGHS